jgi:hypothetical protein
MVCTQGRAWHIRTRLTAGHAWPRVAESTAGADSAPPPPPLSSRTRPPRTHAPTHPHGARAQVEAHPYWRNDALLAFCSAAGVHVTAYSPLGSPDSAGIMGRSKARKGGGGGFQLG